MRGPAVPMPGAPVSRGTHPLRGTLVRGGRTGRSGPLRFAVARRGRRAMRMAEVRERGGVVVVSARVGVACRGLFPRVFRRTHRSAFYIGHSGSASGKRRLRVPPGAARGETPPVCSSSAPLRGVGLGNRSVVSPSGRGTGSQDRSCRAMRASPWLPRKIPRSSPEVSGLTGRVRILST